MCLYIRTYVCTYSLVMYAARDVLAKLALSLSVYTYILPSLCPPQHSEGRTQHSQPLLPAGQARVLCCKAWLNHASKEECLPVHWKVGTCARYTYVRTFVCTFACAHTHSVYVAVDCAHTFFIDLSLLFVHRLIALSLLHCELFPLKLCRHVTKYLMGRPVSDPVEVGRAYR